MTDTPIASYTFLPFARQGLGAHLQGADQAVVAGIRATIPLTLTINAEMLDGSAHSEPVPKDVELYGPGDIIGTRQSGVPELQAADFSDVGLIETARKEAMSLLAADPGLRAPEHARLAVAVGRTREVVTGEVG